MKSLITQYPIPLFIIAAFGFSWVIWIIALLFVPEESQIMWIVPGAYGPTIMAIVLTTIAYGRTGLKNLLSKFLVWRVGVVWYFVVFLLPLLYQFGGIFIYELLNPGTIGSFAPDSLSIWLTSILLAIPIGPLAEELGWSGYLIPRLQGRTNALNSSLILGVLWGLWHFPLFFAPFGTWVIGDPVRAWSVVAYILFTTGARVSYTWIYNNTKGSVLLAILLHAASNASFPFALFPSISDDAAQLMKHWALLPTVIIALVIVWIFGRERLSRGPLVEGETVLSS